MKKLIATITLALLAFAPAAMAEDVTYTAGMTGVTWGGCKKDVSSAFEKLSGFKNIKIEKGDAAGTQKVTVITDGSAEITKEQAVESLGKKAARYVVKTWGKADAKSWIHSVLVK